MRYDAYTAIINPSVAVIVSTNVMMLITVSMLFIVYIGIYWFLFLFVCGGKKSRGLLPTPSSMSLSDDERVGVTVLPNDCLDCHRYSALVVGSAPSLMVVTFLVAEDCDVIVHAFWLIAGHNNPC